MTRAPWRSRSAVSLPLALLALASLGFLLLCAGMTPRTSWDEIPPDPPLSKGGKSPVISAPDAVPDGGKSAALLSPETSVVSSLLPPLTKGGGGDFQFDRSSPPAAPVYDGSDNVSRGSMESLPAGPSPALSPVATGAVTPSEVSRRAVALAARARAVIGDRIIGPEYTSITTTLAPLEAKRLSLHPEFAAAAVHTLEEAGIGPGDQVALHFTGSFPGLNIAVLAAVTALGARPVLVSSVGASTWGATDPDFTWLDMERAIAEAGVWPWRSRGAAIGGGGDRGRGLFPEGVVLAREAIRRAGVAFIEGESLEEAIERRVGIFEEETGSLPRALVNVGGAHAFFGAGGHRAPLREGITRRLGPRLAPSDGLAARFLRSNRPVVHFINVKRLAARFGLLKDGSTASKVLPTGGPLPMPMKGLVALWVVGSLFLLWIGGRKGWWRGPVR